jgi:hypothetical protein
MLSRDQCVPVLFDFLQFVWSQVTSPKIYEIFRRSQGHKGSIRKVLTNLTQKIRFEQLCGAVLCEKIRKSHRVQARIRKDHFVFNVTRQSAVQIERNGTVIVQSTLSAVERQTMLHTAILSPLTNVIANVILFQVFITICRTFAMPVV